MAAVELGLTPTQREVLDMMYATTTVAPVTRRYQNPDGSYRFEKILRETRPIDFAQDGEFALKLHEKKPGDPLSEYFFNLRNLPEGLLVKVAESIAEAAQKAKIEADFCTGIPNAGDPIADKFSLITGLPLLHLFGKAESSSGRRIVAATDLPKGNGRKVLLIDDLITEADTKFEAANVAEEADYRVSGIAVLVDRQQGGVDQLAASGLVVAAALPVSLIFAAYHLDGRLSLDGYIRSMNYLNNARERSNLPKLELLA